MKKLLIIFVILSFANICFADLNEELFKAVNEGGVNQVKALIRKGADINAKSKAGKTAYDIAKERGHTKIAEYLRKLMKK